MHDPVPVDTAEVQFQLIEVEHHPTSRRDADTYSFEEFCNDPDEEKEDYRVVLEQFAHRTPWSPFPTRIDFELAEVMLDSHMNANHIDRLISLFRQAIPNPNESEAFTLTSNSDLAQIWDIARTARATGVSFIIIIIVKATGRAY